MNVDQISAVHALNVVTLADTSAAAAAFVKVGIVAKSLGDDSKEVGKSIFSNARRMVIGEMAAQAAKSLGHIRAAMRRKVGEPGVVVCKGDSSVEVVRLYCAFLADKHGDAFIIAEDNVKEMSAADMRKAYATEGIPADSEGERIAIEAQRAAGIDIPATAAELADQAAAAAADKAVQDAKRDSEMATLRLIAEQAARLIGFENGTLADLLAAVSGFDATPAEPAPAKRTRKEKATA